MLTIRERKGRGRQYEILEKRNRSSDVVGSVSFGSRLYMADALDMSIAWLVGSCCGFIQRFNGPSAF
ncbi:hypothetical protein PUR_39200 [Paenibacillus sp. URB8-2]|nr:hypothetical protein PUR_39200 [Paenibacillus sp. URB8-2]